MPKKDVRRVVFKLVVLVAMIGALFIYQSDTRAQFGSTGCDNNYQYCTNVCGDEHGYNTEPFNECVHGTGGCDSAYFECWESNNPPTGQPQLPCPPCVAECDFNQQQCLAEGTATPTQCAYLGYRCRQRCNYYCIY